MKRFLIAIFIVLAAANIFAQNNTVTIRELTGTVEIQNPGTSNWIRATTGLVVQQAAIISTGFNSTAVLAVGSSTLLVRPITRLSITELISRDGVEIASLNLDSGRVRIEVNPPAGARSSFTVQTNVATSSVRGTIFELDTNSIRVLEGSVIFMPANGSRPVTVNAGQQSVIDEADDAVLPFILAELNSAPARMAGQAAGLPTALRSIPRGSLEIVLELDDGTAP